VLRIEVHSAGVQDRDGAALVLDRITRRFPFLERFFADAGYQGPRVTETAPRPVEIIRRSDAGFVVQPKRWIVERTFAWVGINRRLARDFERFAETARALFQIAMIKLMARRIAATASGKLIGRPAPPSVDRVASAEHATNGAGDELCDHRDRPR
jgi:hypothetical protein